MSEETEHTEFNSLIARYLSGEISPEEEIRFQEILKSDPEKRVRYDEFLKIWDTVGISRGEPSYDLDDEWKLIQTRIPDFNEVANRSRSLLYYSYRVAAVLVIGLMMTFSWIYISRIAGTDQVIAGNTPVEVLLDDGTRVTVNRQSKIRYSKRMSASERKVRLTGEAWFDVARDTLRPFVIDAGSAVVEVLGTSFNVNAYRENESVEITVESGVVAVSSKQDQQEQIVLRAGNSGTYHKEKKELKLIPTSNPNTISWKTRELYFDNTSLQEVADLVNKVYHANLVIENQELSSCPITVTFMNQSLDAVLNVLETTLDLEITRTTDEIRLDGPGCEE